jgi:hypothetical protein
MLRLCCNMNMLRCVQKMVELTEQKRKSRLKEEGVGAGALTYARACLCMCVRAYACVCVLPSIKTPIPPVCQYFFVCSQASWANV